MEDGAMDRSPQTPEIMFFSSLRRLDRCTRTFKGIVAKFAFVVFASNRWSHKDFEGFLFLLIQASFTCCALNAF